MAKRSHDSVFKDLSSEPEFYLSLIQSSLPVELSKQINWQSVRPEKMDSETTREQQQNNAKSHERTDVVYKFKTFDEIPGYFILHCEHQTTVRRESCINNCLTSDKTRYTASGNLSAHALLATARCEAAETMYLCIAQAASREASCHLRVPMWVEG